MTTRTFYFIEEQLASQNLSDGRHVIKESPGGTKIVATIVDGKLTRYEAEDKDGNQHPLFFLRETTLAPRDKDTSLFEHPIPSDTCWTGIIEPDGTTLYYQDFCEIVQDYLMFLQSM